MTAADREEQAAWWYLAMAFDGPSLGLDEFLSPFLPVEYMSRVTGRWGLCASIDDLVKVKGDTKYAMRLKLDGSAGFRWLFTRAGHKQRSAFCWRMAAEFDRE